MTINNDMVLAVPIAALLVILILCMSYVDRTYLNNTIEKLFKNRKFKIILAAIMIFVVLVFFDGKHKGLFFMI
ncbi:hypothetical protein [Gilliamella sp. wkB308]|uniref:hypothetical protein n=1 Tax=Gilliamella sp. wkB308 TaxID=3120263 RepID=UPI00080E5B72|nr:hypothetical protein [Gilliamella apicola]OCG01771.1 hypothetical protein A9G10_03385 [Gilliamella apicola]